MRDEITKLVERLNAARETGFSTARVSLCMLYDAADWLEKLETEIEQGGDAVDSCEAEIRELSRRITKLEVRQQRYELEWRGLIRASWREDYQTPSPRSFEAADHAIPELGHPDRAAK